MYGLFFVFLLTPIGACILSAYQASSNRSIDYKPLYIFFLCFSLFFGLLNTTKVLESDIATYNSSFLDAGRFDLSSYLAINGHEPFYYVLSWLGYRLFFKSWSFFILFITTADFLLLGHIHVLIGRYLSLRNRDIVFATLVSFLFFQEFSLSSHLIRQILGSLMALVFITNWNLFNKKQWWLGALSILTHATVLPFIIIGIVPFMQRRFSFRNLSLIVLSFVVCIGAFMFLIPYLEGIPFLGYFASRLDSDSNILGNDFGRLETGIGVAGYLVFTVLLFLIFSIVKRKSDNLNELNYMLYLPTLLILLLLCANFIEATYLIERFTFYLYPFVGMLILASTYYTRLFKESSVRVSLVLCMVVYFCTYFSFGVFKYESIFEALVNPALLYFMN